MDAMKAAMGLEKPEPAGKKGFSWPLKILIGIFGLGMLQLIILLIIMISHHKGR